MGKEINIIFLDDKGSMFGSADYTRWNNAKWYEKLLGKILPKYKESFVDIKPLKATYKGNGTHEIIYK